MNRVCSYIISTVRAGEDLRQQRQPQDDSAHNLKHTHTKVLSDLAIHVSHGLAKDKVTRFFSPHILLLIKIQMRRAALTKK